MGCGSATSALVVGRWRRPKAFGTLLNRIARQDLVRGMFDSKNCKAEDMIKNTSVLANNTTKSTAEY